MWKGLGGTITGLFILGCATNALAEPLAIGETRYVSERDPIFICSAPQFGWQGCRKLSSGKITITSAAQVVSYAPRWTVYGVKLNDKENVFIAESSWIYLRSEEAQRASEEAHRAKLAAKAECDRRGGVSIGMTKA
jgi:hypothetical protein